MIIHLEGNLNRYYVQTLCMIFFPGEKFSEGEIPSPDKPELWVSLTKNENGYSASARAVLGERSAEAEKEQEQDGTMTDERCSKLAVGGAVIGALGSLLEYRPSWGMLTGVRPSKVATEMLSAGMSKTKVKKTLTSQYMTFPKKAALATDVALNEQKIIGTPNAADCSIYISIPFCPTRCAYCSFVSYTSKRLLSLIPEYVDRLCGDICEVMSAARRLGLRIKTVYVGGGTPTVLSPEQISRLLSTINECVDVGSLEEFTFEAGRPDTITPEKLRAAAQLGVTRMSVNPQTLCPEVLAGIGRTHTVEDFYRAYSDARESGIPCINADLIAGLPGDTFTRFSATVDGILALRPENITVHTFCVKNAAELKQTAGIYSMRGGDVGKCVDYSQIKSQQAGYVPYYMYRQKNTVGNYENVGFALPGYEGRYNIYMMEEVHTILAVGAGAVTKLVRLHPADGTRPVIRRLFNPKYPFEYLRENKCAELCRGIEDFFAEYPL